MTRLVIIGKEPDQSGTAPSNQKYKSCLPNHAEFNQIPCGPPYESRLTRFVTLMRAVHGPCGFVKPLRSRAHRLSSNGISQRPGRSPKFLLASAVNPRSRNARAMPNEALEADQTAGAALSGPGAFQFLRLSLLERTPFGSASWLHSGASIMAPQERFLPTFERSGSKVGRAGRREILASSSRRQRRPPYLPFSFAFPLPIPQEKGRTNPARP